MDLDITITPSEEGKSRKRPVQREKWSRNRKKLLRHRAKDLPEFPKCRHLKKPIYTCGELSMRDLQNFHKMIYSTTDKVRQDIFVLKFCEGSHPKKNKTNLHGISIKYFIPTIDGRSLRVCKKAFLGITHFSSDRIERLVRNFMQNGDVPKERRGGDRVGEKNKEIKDSIKLFIENLNCVESHYQRKSTNRLYLPCELNFTKLYNIFCERNPNKSVKISYFRNYVNSNYNLSFGTPLSDACSTCMRTQEMIKKTDSEEEKQRIMLERRLHVLKSKAFYNYLKSESEDIAMFSFDCEKNLALPKLPDQSAYFSQQLNFYNFTIVCGNSKTKLSNKTVRSYVWLETEYPKNSNSISSAVYHNLLDYNFQEHIKKIQLFADGCGGQNKNSTLMTMLAFWFSEKAPNTITSMEVIFPVVGHSFLPPDRVFGLIERSIKKQNIIVKAEQYENIIQRFSRVLKLEQDWQVHDWKLQSKNFVKKPGQWHYQFNKTKRFIFSKGNGTILIRGEESYRSDLGVPKTILKKGKRYSSIVPPRVQLSTGLKGDKSTIERLLKNHYGNDWKDHPDLQYYTRVLTSAPVQFEIDSDEDNLEDEDNLRV